MVIGNYEFVSVWQHSKPVIEAFHVGQRALPQTVAGMDQHITLRYCLNASMQAAGIGKTDQPHQGLPRISFICSNRSSSSNRRRRSRRTLSFSTFTDTWPSSSIILVLSATVIRALHA